MRLLSTRFHLVLGWGCTPPSLSAVAVCHRQMMFGVDVLSIFRKVDEWRTGYIPDKIFMQKMTELNCTLQHKVPPS